MKKRFSILLAGFALMLASLTTGYNLDAVLNSLKRGNSAGIARYFDSRVDITLPNKADNYSKNQGELVLREFFSNNPVKNFELKHKGEIKGAQFCIGSLQTANGNFRTKIYMRRKGDADLIQEIAFENEN
mgnify:FL=1|jgi:hypothetical protein